MCSDGEVEVVVFATGTRSVEGCGESERVAEIVEVGGMRVAHF